VFAPVRTLKMFQEKDNVLTFSIKPDNLLGMVKVGFVEAYGSRG
jgi:hypothetical protein